MPGAGGLSCMMQQRKFLDKVRELENIIELEECPACRGAGVITHEGGWSVQVECADCSAHTIYMEYNNDEEKKAAEQAVAHLWNIGKVVTSERGE